MTKNSSLHFPMLEYKLQTKSPEMEIRGVTIKVHAVVFIQKLINKVNKKGFDFSKYLIKDQRLRRKYKKRESKTFLRIIKLIL